MEKSICVFGDSTAWGAWDCEKGGWVNRLWLHLSKRNHEADYYVKLYNLSISGGTTGTILARFEREAMIREADVLIFQTGVNDAAYEHTEDNYLVPPDQFRMNLEQIIRKAKVVTDEIVFMGTKNVDETKTMPVFWRDVYYTNANLKKYNDITKDMCTKSNVLFLELLGLLKNNDLHDGLHPNEKGHEKLFEAVKTYLENNKII